MITINQSQTNDGILFYPVASLDTHLLIVMTRRCCGFSKTFVTPLNAKSNEDCSSNTYVITEVGYNGVEDLNDGKVSLETGYYDVSIYSQDNSLNLDPDLATFVTSTYGRVNSDDNCSREFM